MTPRSLLLLGAAVLAFSISVGLFSANGESPAPAAGAAVSDVALRGTPAAEPPGGTVRVDLLNRAAQARPPRDAFSPRLWQPVLPPPPASVEPPPPPPPPAAPALPFTFMGRLESPGEKTVYYLLAGDRLHVVTEGETIDGTHRIESVQGDRMQILYIPLSIVQALALEGDK